MKKRFLTICCTMLFVLAFALSACSVEPSNEDYVKAYESVVNVIDEISATPNIASNGTIMTFRGINDNISDSAFSSLPKNDQNYNVFPTWLLFVRNLYQNEEYENIVDPQKFSVEWKLKLDGEVQNDWESFEVTMQNYSTEDGVLHSDMYILEGGSGVDQSMSIDIDYDFGKEKLNKFALAAISAFGEDEFYMLYYYFDGEEIRIANTSSNEYKTLLDSYVARHKDIVSKQSGAKNLGDCSRIYGSAMVEQASKVYPNKTFEAVYKN